MTRSRSQGTALVLALFALGMAATLGNVLMERTAFVQEETKRDGESLQAFWAAEGGVAHARHALAADPDWAGGTAAIGGEEVVVTVARDPARGGWNVVSRTGSVRIVVRLVAAAPYPRVVDWTSQR